MLKKIRKMLIKNKSVFIVKVYLIERIGLDTRDGFI